MNQNYKQPGISVVPKTKYVVNQDNTYVFAAGQLPNGDYRIIPNEKFKLQKGQVVYGTRVMTLNVSGQGQKQFAVILTGDTQFRLVFLSNLDLAPTNFVDDEPEGDQINKSISGINRTYLMVAGTFLPGFIAMFFLGAILGPANINKTSKLVLAFAVGSAIGGYMTAKILKKQDEETLSMLGTEKGDKHPGTKDTRIDK